MTYFSLTRTIKAEIPAKGITTTDILSIRVALFPYSSHMKSLARERLLTLATHDKYTQQLERTTIATTSAQLEQPSDFW